MKLLVLVFFGLNSSLNSFGASLDLVTHQAASPGDHSILIARNDGAVTEEWDYLVLVPNWLDEVAIFGFKDYKGSGPQFMGRVFHGRLSAEQTFESTESLLKTLVIDEDFSRIKGASRNSAMTSVMSFVPERGKPEWMGENHGNEEIALAPEFSLDGEVKVLLPGEVQCAKEFKITQQSRLLHSQVSKELNPNGVALKTITYSATAGDAMDLRAHVKLEWNVKGKINNYYVGMLDAGYSSRPSLPYTHVRVGDLNLGLGDLAEDNNTEKGKIKTDAMAFVRPTADDPARQIYALVHLPDAVAATQNWAHSSPNYAFVMDRNTGGEKLYFARSTGKNPEFIEAGQVHEFDIGWQVRTTEIDLIK